MARRPRRNHDPAFEAKVAVAAIGREKIAFELAQGLDFHPNRIRQWRGQLLEGPTEVFCDGPKAEPEEPAIDLETLHAQIGELTPENDSCPARSAGRVCCRAQENDRSRREAERRPSGRE